MLVRHSVKRTYVELIEEMAGINFIVESVFAMGDHVGFIYVREH